MTTSPGAASFARVESSAARQLQAELSNRAYLATAANRFGALTYKAAEAVYQAEIDAATARLNTFGRV